MTNDLQLTARNATPQDLVKILNDQKAHKLDLVVPASSMQSKDGMIRVRNAEPEITEDGVTSTVGTYRPTSIFDEGLAAKLEIPSTYLRKLRERGRTDIIDGNVNGLLHGRTKVTRQPGGSVTEVIHQPDARAFLLRLFKGDDGGEGVARAMLSDRYGITMDNLDILTAVMSGIQAAGVSPTVRVSDLSERAMRVRFEFPDVNALAPGLLDGYRTPFKDGGPKRAGGFDDLRQRYGAHHIFRDEDAPVCFMGFDLRNSETGGGAYTLAPVIVMVKCTNGWTIQREGIRKIHRGALLEQGLIRTSSDTVRKAGELVVAETRDAVATWLSDGYLAQLVAGLEAKGGVPIASPTETVPAICQGLGFSETERQGVLDMFILSGRPDSAGLAQAVSAFAQTVEDVDRAYEIELATVDALEAAASRG
jgi:hypothetical protein